MKPLAYCAQCEITHAVDQPTHARLVILLRGYFGNV